jgi:arylsulfatase
MPESPFAQPNFLFIMADQHRFDFLGAVGAGFVNTPNLDRLARSGMLMTHCCTNSPICAPARCSLAAGMQPEKIGCVTNQDPLPDDVVTYYQRLRDTGYEVACVGKLDLDKPSNMKLDQPWRDAYLDKWGFTSSHETEGKCGPYPMQRPAHGPYTHYLEGLGLLQPLKEDFALRQEGEKNLSEDFPFAAEHFHDVYIGREAVRWLEQAPADQPWHYFVSFVGPHNPYDPPREYAEKYRDADVPAPVSNENLSDKPERIRRRQNDRLNKDVIHARRQYCAAIELIDDQVGAILNRLEQREDAENTYIIFSSDHGDSMGDLGLWDKHTAYESSLRVPLIIAGPGIAAGRESSALVELSDLNPTICELAGLPDQAGIDARTITPLLFDKSKSHRKDALTAEKGYCALRTETHKCIITQGPFYELYDLEDDPGETHNIADEAPELLDKLLSRLRDRIAPEFLTTLENLDH